MSVPSVAPDLHERSKICVKSGKTLLCLATSTFESFAAPNNLFISSGFDEAFSTVDTLAVAQTSPFVFLVPTTFSGDQVLHICLPVNPEDMMASLLFRNSSYDDFPSTYSCSVSPQNVHAFLSGRGGSPFQALLPSNIFATFFRVGVHRGNDRTVSTNTEVRTFALGDAFSKLPRSSDRPPLRATEDNYQGLSAAVLYAAVTRANGCAVSTDTNVISCSAGCSSPKLQRDFDGPQQQHHPEDGYKGGLSATVLVAGVPSVNTSLVSTTSDVLNTSSAGCACAKLQNDFDRPQQQHRDDADKGWSATVLVAGVPSVNASLVAIHFDVLNTSSAGCACAKLQRDFDCPQQQHGDDGCQGLSATDLIAGVPSVNTSLVSTTSDVLHTSSAGCASPKLQRDFDGPQQQHADNADKGWSATVLVAGVTRVTGWTSFIHPFVRSSSVCGACVQQQSAHGGDEYLSAHKQIGFTLAQPSPHFRSSLPGLLVAISFAAHSVWPLLVDTFRPNSLTTESTPIPEETASPRRRCVFLLRLAVLGAVLQPASAIPSMIDPSPSFTPSQAPSTRSASPTVSPSFAPYVVDLSLFTSGAGVRIIGSQSSKTGQDMVQIGDHNGDNFTDYMIGAPGLSTVIIVMKKNTTYTPTSISSIRSGQYFRVINGVSGSSTGGSLGGIGDINGDSFDDVIIGSEKGQIFGRGNVGYAYVIFGMQGPFTDLALSATWAASSLGFMILGVQASSGLAVRTRMARGLGDVNDDGVDDFAVSAPAYGGTVWLIWGNTTTSFATIDLLPTNFDAQGCGIRFTAAAASDRLGSSIMPAGDFNNDGIADFLIGSFGYNPVVGGTTVSAGGVSYLIFGSRTALITAAMSTFVTGSNGVRFFGTGTDDNLGRSLAGVGDVNADGIDDIALGAPQAATSAGRVYVIYGNTGTYSADVYLSTISDFNKGFIIYGSASSMQLCGPAPAGDVDGDGVNDLLVGGLSTRSPVHIVYGQKRARTTDVLTSTGDVMTFTYPTITTSTVGIAIDGGKDLNGDGFPDILFGGGLATVTPEGGGTSITSAGAAWMIAGPFKIPYRTAPPTESPSGKPSATPSLGPSAVPSIAPSIKPSLVPSTNPTESPSMEPSVTPSAAPSQAPSAPSASPTASPSFVPYVVDLSLFTSGTGVRIIGPTSARTGFDIVQIGDHNGDNYTDFMTSASSLNTVVIVMKQNTTYNPVSITSIQSGMYFRVIKAPSGMLGSSLGGIGDINGDSFDDVVITSPNGIVSGRSGAVGNAFVIFGMQGPFTDLTLSATWAASSLGFMLLGAASGSNFASLPRMARGLGDVNGDGVDDFAISATTYDTGGTVWVIWGNTSSSFTTIDLLRTNFDAQSHGIRFTGTASTDQLGSCIMPAGDFNNDGIADFLIGANEFVPVVGGTRRTSAGAAYLVYGSKTALVTTSMSSFVTGSRGIRFFSTTAGDLLGRSLAGVGDVNDDGIDDIALGAPSSSAGRLYVIYGNTGTYSADVYLSAVNDFAKGFIIYASSSSMQLCVPAPAGDLDGDGVNDLLVGGLSTRSPVHIVFGQKGIRTTNVLTSTGEVMTLSYPGVSYMGRAIDGGKDLNGDGFPDILIGGYGAAVTPEGGGTSILGSGAAWMIPGPFRFPSPTVSPTVSPSGDPSATPSVVPSRTPSDAPTLVPSTHPTESPSIEPSLVPTVPPTQAPSAPSVSPTASPSFVPYVVDLSLFTSGAGVRIIGSQSSRVGHDNVQIGDHNGDNFTDFMVTSPATNTVVIVMKKNTTYTPLTIASIRSGQYFRVIKGPSGSITGNTLGGIGDINGDSFDDVIIGAANGMVSGRSNAGYLFIIFGMQGPFADLTLTATWAASTLGFMVLGVINTSNLAARSRMARGLGDINGDGIDDFAVSAYTYGAVWVIFGKVSSSFTTIDLFPTNFDAQGCGIRFTAAAAADQLGACIMPAGDFNNDGIADFLIGANLFDPVVSETTISNGGASYLIFGSRTTLVSTSMSSFVTGSKGVRFFGTAVDDNLGRSLAGVGDVNDDCIDDIAIGAPQSTSSAGLVYVIYGNTGTYSADVFLSTINDFSRGFIIYGSASSMQLCVPTPAGDLDGDGVNDLLVGGLSTRSPVHIVYGQKGTRTTDVLTSTGEVMSFTYPSSSSIGVSVDGGKDLNGDGFPDILIGGSGATVTVEGGGNIIRAGGATWMISGPFKFPSPTAIPSVSPSAQPSAQPSSQPSDEPSAQPSRVPSQQPMAQPSSIPSAQPNGKPSMQPSGDPSVQPSGVPSSQPLCQPSGQPSAQPSTQPSTPSSNPSAQPTGKPTTQPSFIPSAQPNGKPSMQPSGDPSVQPSGVPSSQPSCQPSGQPSVRPTVQPSSVPSAQSSARPSTQPSGFPSAQPLSSPTTQPSDKPSSQPNVRPTAQPSALPSSRPSLQPSTQPAATPSTQPSSQPSRQPLTVPSAPPSAKPSAQPSREPSAQPSSRPSSQPTSLPSIQPSGQPSARPTVQPSRVPSSQPVSRPSEQPSGLPSTQPSSSPSQQPSAWPSAQPSSEPSCIPSTQPIGQPSSRPSSQPSAIPSAQPTTVPSKQPVTQPSTQPTALPSIQPSVNPSVQPSSVPSGKPSDRPSAQPNGLPSVQPSGQPSSQPSAVPSAQPSGSPSLQPAGVPSGQPSCQPSVCPSIVPSTQPSMQPAAQPSVNPSAQPSAPPSSQPNMQPSIQPSAIPSIQPSGKPSAQPLAQPSTQPSIQPSAIPSSQPSDQPASGPSAQPNVKPSSQPSAMPSIQPSCNPSFQPLSRPSGQPSVGPSSMPSTQPSIQPTIQPSVEPSAQPSAQPSGQPSTLPSAIPSSQPLGQPSMQPTSAPSAQPSEKPSSQPSAVPSAQPSAKPSGQPSSRPSNQPSAVPSAQPTTVPSAQPTDVPSAQPSTQPSTQPSGQPSVRPSAQPSSAPSGQPSVRPSAQPSAQPSSQPSTLPSANPSSRPSGQPSMQPTSAPSAQPSEKPSSQPSAVPSAQPSSVPSLQPSIQPTTQPSGDPSAQPSAKPSSQPNTQPSIHPSTLPSAIPSSQPSDQPSMQPTSAPSAQPSAKPSSQPSSVPTAQSSGQPSTQPSRIPSADPSEIPSANPSVHPTAHPTLMPTVVSTVTPTAIPSVGPSARPSEVVYTNFAWIANVEQKLFAVTKSSYDEHKAAYNLTIQHTVAAVLEGVTPERVTNIAVEESGEVEKAIGDRLRGSAGGKYDAAALPSVLLTYKIAIFDPLLTLEKLREGLTLAAREGTMDSDLHLYAAQFGAVGMTNSTFAEPQTVTVEVLPSAASSGLTVVQIACIIVGILMGLILLTAFATFGRLNGLFGTPVVGAKASSPVNSLSNPNRTVPGGNKLRSTLSSFYEPFGTSSGNTDAGSNLVTAAEPEGGTLQDRDLFCNTFSEPYGEAYCHTIDGAIGQTFGEIYTEPQETTYSSSNSDSLFRSFRSIRSMFGSNYELNGPVSEPGNEANPDTGAATDQTFGDIYSEAQEESFTGLNSVSRAMPTVA